MTTYRLYWTLHLIVKQRWKRTNFRMKSHLWISSHLSHPYYQTVLIISYTRYPKQLNCSKSFLECCKCIKELITNYYTFAEGFTQHNNEMDDLLKKAVDSLIAQAICSSLTQKFETDEIRQVCQIVVNLDHFELACADIENTLSDHR